MVTSRDRRRSPTAALLPGLLATLAIVIAYSWYMSVQIAGLRELQTDLTDRHRLDSLQLLRIQNELHGLGLAMRDMLDGDQPYPLAAWTAQFDRIRLALDDALARQAEVAVTRRTPEQQAYLATSLAQFWEAADRMFALTRNGRDDEARAQIRISLQARQAALSTTVARLLVQNNEREADTARRVQEIYADVQRQVYVLLAGTLAAIVLTSLYLIRSTRRLFAQLASLSDARREIARTLLATRESTLREISRELHDQLGQLLTAMGSMIGRAERRVIADDPLRADLREIREIAQTALDNVRGLSQALHPSTLEELGLESTIDWYLSTVEKSLGIRVAYLRTGLPVPVGATVAIHVYRVLQEALSNVARHSDARVASVRMHFAPGQLRLEIEDRGRGFDADAAPRGLGLIAMRERAALLEGTLAIEPVAGGGTRVRLAVPVPPPEREETVPALRPAPIARIS